MTENSENPLAPRDLEEGVIEGATGASHLRLEDLNEVKLSIAADLGRSGMLVKEIFDLKVGSVVTLDKMAGEMTEVYVNGLPLGRGEVVVIGDSLHVRIAEIIGASELLERHGG